MAHNDESFNDSYEDNILYRKFKNEQYIARINNKYNKFLGKWSSLVHPLNTM